MKQIFIFCILFSCFSLRAQNRSVATQENLWGVYTGTFKLYGKLHLYTESQFRRAEMGKEWQQILLRGGLEYKFKPEIQAMVGYAFVITYPYGEQPVTYEFNENRLWEQLTITQPAGKLKIQHRYRLEQRWLEQKKFDSSANDYKKSGEIYLNRVRYRLMVTYPLVKFPSANSLFFQMADEVFIAFGKNIDKNIFDQNRIYGGIGFNFKDKISISLGYLNQFIIKSTGTRAENNHTIQLGFNLSF